MKPQNTCTLVNVFFYCQDNVLVKPSIKKNWNNYVAALWFYLASQEKDRKSKSWLTLVFWNSFVRPKLGTFKLLHERFGGERNILKNENNWMTCKALIRTEDAWKLRAKCSSSETSGRYLGWHDDEVIILNFVFLSRDTAHDTYAVIHTQFTPLGLMASYAEKCYDPSFFWNSYI